MFTIEGLFVNEEVFPLGALRNSVGGRGGGSIAAGFEFVVDKEGCNGDAANPIVVTFWLLPAPSVDVLWTPSFLLTAKMLCECGGVDPAL